MARKEAFKKKFEENLLEKYNVRFNDLKEWKYCGGDRDEHLRYFNLVFPCDCELNLNEGLCDCNHPEKESNCVCGHHIEEQCYIQNENDKTRLITLGNCCIKKFLIKSRRTCDVCGNVHRNRKINRCNNCKNLANCKICLALFVVSDHKELCASCDSRFRLCQDCKVQINKNQFKRCVTCQFGSKCTGCGRSCPKKFKTCFSCFSTVAS